MVYFGLRSTRFAILVGDARAQGDAAVWFLRRICEGSNMHVYKQVLCVHAC